MALSGSVTVPATTWDDLVFSWTAVQDKATKSSTVSWKMELVAGDYGRIDASAGSPWVVTIDGQEFTGTSDLAIENNETKTLAEGEVVLSHEADGTKSFEFTFSQEFYITFAGEEIDVVSGEGTGELDRIAGFDILAWLHGYLLALCAPARQFPQREPVAFLYNGVRLPGVPVAEGMEFAFIYKLTSTYTVVFTDSYEFGSNSENVFWHITVPDGNQAYMLTPENEWRQLSSTSAREVNYEYIIWANFDVPAPSGEVYLAASAPVPVYE